MKGIAQAFIWMVMAAQLGSILILWNAVSNIKGRLIDYKPITLGVMFEKITWSEEQIIALLEKRDSEKHGFRSGTKEKRKGKI